MTSRCGLPCFFEILDLVGCHIQQGKLHARRFQQARSTRTHFHKRTLAQRFAGLEGKKIFFLSGEQVGTVDGKERLAHGDVLEGGIHENLLHPSTHLTC